MATTSSDQDPSPRRERQKWCQESMVTRKSRQVRKECTRQRKEMQQVSSHSADAAERQGPAPHARLHTISCYISFFLFFSHLADKIVLWEDFNENGWGDQRWSCSSRNSLKWRLRESPDVETVIKAEWLGGGPGVVNTEAQTALPQREILG